jgi:PAS domain S-box-containing protein
LRRGLKPLRFALIYGAFGGLWILITDWLASDGTFWVLPLTMGTAKGFFYVAVTAALVYALIRVMVRDAERERKWYQDLFETSPHPMWVHDKKTERFLAVNSSTTKRFGYTQKEFLSMTLADIGPPEEIFTENAGAEESTRAGAGPRIWHHALKNGSIIRAEISAHTVNFKGRQAELVMARDITQQQEVEDAVRNARVFLETIISCSPLALLTITPEGKVLSWNASAERIFGWRAQEVIGKPVPFVPEENQAEFARLRQRAMAGETLTGIELTRRRKDGTTVETRLSASRLNGLNRVGIGILALVEDITDRKQAESSLLKSKQRFYQLADSIPNMVWTAGPDGRVDFANRATTEYSGIPADEHLGDRWPGLMHPDDLAPSMETWMEAARTGKPFSSKSRIRRASDGSYRWHQSYAVPVRDAKGNIDKWYGTSTDVHEIKYAEEHARDLAHRLTATLESITDAFLTIDHEWRFTYVNGEAEKMLKRSRGELLGRSLWTEFPAVSGSIFETEYRRAIKSGETVSFEGYYPPPLDAWFAVRAYPSDIGLAIYFRDTTESRRTEAALRESENRFLELAENIEDVFYNFDPNDNKMLYISPAYEKEWGRTVESLYAKPRSFLDPVHPDDIENVVADMYCGRHTDREYRITRPDGEMQWIRARSYPICDAKGNVKRIVGIASNITLR